MNCRILPLMVALPALALAAFAADAVEEKAHKLTTISPRKMADSLQAVIAADQLAYVETTTQSHAGQKGTMPAHAEVLRKAAQAIQKRGAEFSYTLRSLAPINPNNGPQTQAEQTGLETVAKHPNEAYYTEEELGGRSYFTAVYANVASVNACVTCHNADTRSPRRDWKQGDAMGAIVVRVPLEF